AQVSEAHYQNCFYPLAILVVTLLFSPLGLCPRLCPHPVAAYLLCRLGRPTGRTGEGSGGLNDALVYPNGPHQILLPIGAAHGYAEKPIRLGYDQFVFLSTVEAGCYGVLRNVRLQYEPSHRHPRKSRVEVGFPPRVPRRDVLIERPAHPVIPPSLSAAP